MKSIESKKLYLSYSPALKNTTWATVGHILSKRLFFRETLVRCGQCFGGAMLAGGLYILNIWSGDGVRLLVALAAVSALPYIVLAVQCRTRTLVLLNLLAVPVLFMTAYAGLYVATEWLIISYILHGSLIAVQLSSVDNDLRDGLFCWSVFNSAIALLLLLGW